MPYIKLETNKEMSALESRELVQKLSAFCAEMLGKPEDYVMAVVKPGMALCHGGSLALAVYVECKSIGLPKDKCGAFTKALCGFMESQLKVPPTRVYVEFKDLDRAMFGWDNKVF